MSEKTLPSGLSETFNTKSAASAEDFLKTEYELLNEWAVHAEDVAHRIFNFYITLLTAVLGGVLVLVQVLSLNAQASLIIVAGACGFLILFGVGFFDALVSQYIQNAHYHAGMRAIRAHFRRYDIVASSLLEVPFVFPEKRESISQRLIFTRFGFPGGNQLSMIQGINSLMLAVLIWSLAWGIGGVGFRPLGTALASVVGVSISIVTHGTLASLMIRRNIARIGSGQSAQIALEAVSSGAANSTTPTVQEVNRELNKPEGNGES